MLNILEKMSTRLPNKIIGIPNPDKTFHEHWYKGRNLINFTHPFRLVALGPPSCGKSCSILNVILRARPEFEEIFVIHCDPNYTKEYDQLGEGYTMLESIPAQDEWEGKVKTLVVCDDLDFKHLDKDQQRNLSRLFGYASTHKNISVCLCAQDPFNVPPIVRRCSNVWILWKMSDMDSMAVTARKTGLKSLAFKKIFQKLMTEPHDSLWIDLTDGSPMKLRKNGYQAINMSKEGREMDDDNS